MATIVTRSGKGTPLTFLELDGNFNNLNADKLDINGIPLGSASSPTIKFSGDSNTGIFSPGPDQISLSTSGTERLRINSSGNVGLGSALSASTLLELSGNNDAGATNTLRFTDIDITSQLNQKVGRIEFYTNDATSPGVVSYIEGVTDSIDATGSIVIGTGSGGSASSKFVINSSGNVGIGVNSPEAKLDITSTSDNTGGVGGDISGSFTSANRAAKLNLNFNSIWVTGTNQPLSFGTSGVERLRIDSSGNTIPGADNSYTLGASGARWSVVWAANGTIQTSDERQKIEISTSTLGLDFIKSLRPVSYKWKIGRNEVSTNEDGETILTPVPGSRTHWGFLAQEVKATVDAVGVDFGGWIQSDPEDPESEQGLRYDQFIAPVVKALQEAIERIETLEQKVSVLENKKNISTL